MELKTSLRYASSLSIISILLEKQEEVYFVYHLRSSAQFERVYKDSSG